MQLDPQVLPLSSTGIAGVLELVTANIANPTELNAIGLAVPDLRLVRTNVAGSDDATLYRLDTSSSAVNAPYVMASVTGALRWVAIAGRYVNQAMDHNGVVTMVNALLPTSGGTGIAGYAVGDIIYASTTTALSKLADVATGNALLSGGVGTAPAWGKIALSTHVSGILPSANGGTGVNNAGTITNASNTTITGGGTVALGGFTLTVPATGTAGLLGAIQTWSAANTFSAVLSTSAGQSNSGTTQSDFSAGIKVTGGPTTFTGSGFELAYNGTTASLLAIDRAGPTFKQIDFNGDNVRFLTFSVAALTISNASAVLAVMPTGGLGYGTGAGGTVTQITSKATGVTLNKVCGAITLINAALAANTLVQFTLTNSTIAASDIVDVVVKSGGTAGAYQVWSESAAAGSVTISVLNRTAGSLSEALVLSFAVLKAAIA